MRNRIVAILGAVAFMLAPAAAHAQSDPLGSGTQRTESASIVVGSADFPESQLLATIYAKALSAKGIAVDTRMNIGSREVYVPALLDGSIDLLPEYAGAMLSYLDKKSSAHSPDEVAAALKSALPRGITMLTPSPAEDSDAVVVTRATAEAHKLKTISDLTPVAGDMVLGGSPEWKNRTEGLLGLQSVYGLRFKAYKALDVGGPITLSALLNGQIQIANLYTTDSSITAHDLVVLEDVKFLFPAQNVVPIMAENKASETVRTTLNAISAALTTADLTKMNERLANHEGFDQVADDWLKANGLD